GILTASYGARKAEIDTMKKLHYPSVIAVILLICWLVCAGPFSQCESAASSDSEFRDAVVRLHEEISQQSDFGKHNFVVEANPDHTGKIERNGCGETVRRTESGELKVHAWGQKPFQNADYTYFQNAALKVQRTDGSGYTITPVGTELRFHSWGCERDNWDLV